MFPLIFCMELKTNKESEHEKFLLSFNELLFKFMKHMLEPGL